MRIESAILSHLVHDEVYARKVIPFIKPEYFEDLAEQSVFKTIDAFINKYNSLPTAEALGITLDSQTGFSEEQYKAVTKIVDNLKLTPEATSQEWLIENTEKFCQDRSITLAIMDSIAILDGKDKVRTKESLPELLKNALAVSFDTNVGHDFIEDFESRFEFYHRKEEKVPFDIEYFNKITRGGFARKTLNIWLAGPHVGKSLIMCHAAAANLTAGKNVLYITMEMAEEKIAERIDANLMDVMIAEIEDLPLEVYEKKINRIKSKTIGKLIIKEYPAAAVHAGHFRHLLDELWLKKNFQPDIIYIDYLNICCSARLKMGANINTYSYIKSIAEELRGLAFERNVPIVSATQTNRPGFTSSDPGLQDTSESFGLPATADFMCAIITNDDLKEANQYMFKQLKNRYRDMNLDNRFVVGVDRARMKLYDCEQSAQEDVLVMDKTSFGQRAKEDDQMQFMTKKQGRRDFSELKVK